ncbi:hypothetical protein KY285_015372 [Solanum tuberosum]|nr:hypothetical protein KY285_015372 [Solanum tuberosum]
MAIQKIDQNDPLYIGPSDTSGVVLISIKLTGSENYGIWSRSMRIALLGKRKYGFVTGACTRALYRDELHKQWETYNAIVPSWLMNTVSEDLLSGIVYAATAFSVWAYLEESGLNESYDQARRQILLKGSTPSLNQAYAMVIEDEIQHTNYIASVVEKPDRVAMNVHKNQKREYYKGKKCDFCHYTGHTKDNCYKLIGYSDGWEQRRKSGNTFRNTSGASHNGSYMRQFPASSSHYGGQHSANNAAYDHSEEASTSQGSNSTSQSSRDFIPKGNAFTDQEYRQILELLNKDAKESKQINMSSMVTCLMANNFAHDWIVDTGASHHIIADKQLFTRSHSLTKSQQNRVHLPTGAQVDISDMGEVPMFTKESIKNVLHVPYFKFSLLSVSKITKELSCYDLSSGRVKGIGREEGGLYYFKREATSNHRQKTQFAAHVKIVRSDNGTEFFNS